MITYAYEVLGRLTSKSGAGLSATYEYDVGGTNGIGRRTSMNDALGSATYAYDQRGRLTNLARTISGYPGFYRFTTTYDAQDRVLSLTYPNGDVLAYAYGDHGMPISATLNGSPLVSGVTYNALKKATSLLLGNGVQTTWKYFGLDASIYLSPNAFYGLPYQVQTGTLQNQTFPNANTLGYDLVGNVTAIDYSDHTTENLTFSYNELDQLLGMAGTVGEGYGDYRQQIRVQPYTWYDIGNLLQLGTISPAYGGYPPHAPSSAGSAAYRYDANGNRASDGANTYTYDVENHLTGVSGAVSIQNSYDGDGVRLVRGANGTTTHYVGDWYEYDPIAEQATVYYPFNGKPIAMNKDNGTLYWLHHDHLGSLVAVSDASGQEVASARYWPFGGLRASTGTLPTDRLFTGQTRDLGDDRFYFFQSRYYDATIGRFHTPDTVVPDPKNPQALNRYAYALNNPLRFVDPSGHAATDNGGGGGNLLGMSLNDFQKMTWQQRQVWLAQFQQQYHTAGWFNNVAGILDYFSKSSAFQNSPYMQLADAGVLKAIEDGEVASQAGGVVAGSVDGGAAAGWKNFFNKLASQQARQGVSDADLKAAWGPAEQLGVNYGVSIANAKYGLPSGRPGRMVGVFVAAGNLYRAAVTTGVGVVGTAGLRAFSWSPDPRQDRAFVDTVATDIESGENPFDPVFDPFAGLGSLG